MKIKADALSLHVFLRDPSLKVYEEKRIGGYIRDSDVSGSDYNTSDEDGCHSETTTRFTSDELLASTGPYNHMAKYNGLSAPADAPLIRRGIMRTKQFK